MGRARRTAAGAAAVAVGALVTSMLVGQAWATPAHADGVGGTPAGASYTVKVVVTGNGVGKGGSLGSPGSSSTSLSIPTLCGYTSEEGETQASEEAMWRSDDQIIPWLKGTHQTVPKDGKPTDDQVKAYILKMAGNPDGKVGIDYETSMWEHGIVDNWGQSGTWYIDGCTGGQTDKYFNNFAANNPPVLSGAGNPPLPNNPPIAPGVLLAAAERVMTLPHVQTVLFSPTGRTYVNLPTYMWARESAPLAPGDVKSVTATAQARGPVQSATVTATYTGTNFTASTATVGCSDADNTAAAARAGGNQSSCAVFTGSGANITVTAEPQWGVVGQECLPGCTPPVDLPAPLPDAIDGAGRLAVAEIQTLDR